jgi:hypothetical protein
MDNFTIQQIFAAIAQAQAEQTETSIVRSTITAVATVPLEEMAAAKKLQKRCGFSECKHKLALSDMDCKCGVRHCSKHRMPEDHACRFDFKARDRAVLGKQLVACVGDKIEERI